jgi:nucleoid-associated protein YgaU
MFARWMLLLLALAAALALAVPRPSSGASGEQRYVVKPGDTLWELASERFGGDSRAAIREIRERNGLADVLLEPGMTLYLPAQAGDAQE